MAQEPSGTDRFRLGACVVGLLIGAHLVWSDGAIGELLYLGATGGAALVALLAGTRRPKGDRSGALWLAFGIGASAVGDLTFRLLTVIQGAEPAVSVADVAWLASYVGVTVGILKLLSHGRREWKSTLDDDGLIDMAVTAVVFFLIVWHFWAGPMVGDTSTPLLTRTVWAAYPILDAALLGLLVRTLTNRRLHRVTLATLAGGAICWFAADFTYLLMPDSATVGPFLDAGWMLGAVLLAGGAVGRSNRSGTTRAEGAPDVLRVGAPRIVATFVPLLVPGVLELVAYVEGIDANPIPLLAATAALTALACTRAVLLAAIARDTNLRLAASTNKYRRLTEHSADAVILLSGTGEILGDDISLATLLGASPRPGRSRAVDLVASEDTERTRQLLGQTLASPGVVFEDELRVRRGDGSNLWIAVRVVNLLTDPDVGAIVANVHDITSRKHAEQELEHRAFHDSLTGLANRALFRDRLDHALDRRGRTGLDPVVIYVDVDGFKTVNDSLGHDAGDELLRTIAGRIAMVVRVGDTVARLGGDEFAILVEPVDSSIEAEGVTQRLLEVLASPIDVGGDRVQLSASIGLAEAGADSTASSLLRDADVAMYQAKAAGKNRWVRYEPEMRDAAIQRLQIARQLTCALAARQFHLHYQPVLNLENEQIIGFEALIRWSHPELGPLSPDEFIPVAEENGCIVAIGRWVLDSACHTVAGWRQRYPERNLTIAVNVSAVQLSSATLANDVRNALQASGLDPGALVLEITETALINDPEGAAGALRELRNIGVRVAIDDFGTGYSSLSYLQQFPIDILKVDRSFVQTITDADTPAIVRGLLEFGHTLRLEIVAEGIESTAQLHRLRAQHCEQGQGFLFSPPLDPADAEALLDRELSATPLA